MFPIISSFLFLFFPITTTGTTVLLTCFCSESWRKSVIPKAAAVAATSAKPLLLCSLVVVVVDVAVTTLWPRLLPPNNISTEFVAVLLFFVDEEDMTRRQLLVAVVVVAEDWFLLHWLLLRTTAARATLDRHFVPNMMIDFKKIKLLLVFVVVVDTCTNVFARIVKKFGCISSWIEFSSCSILRFCIIRTTWRTGISTTAYYTTVLVLVLKSPSSWIYVYILHLNLE